MNVRTRYAPSPTGFMHVGNLRTAIFEYLLAKSDKGTFILRIEDTDRERQVEGAVEFIYDTLKLCNVTIDEGPSNAGKFGPYIQSERLPFYSEYAYKMIEMGKAYPCFCSEERLNNLREQAEKNKVPFQYDGYCCRLSKEEVTNRISSGEPYVIRQKMPKDGVSTFNDIVYGEIKVENKVLEDQILLKSDGFPTYNFANVIDDHLMAITHVIRGNEYIMSTPKYNLIYDAFDWEPPTYIHVPMVLGSDGQKLSKRNGDASFMDLYRDGYLPEAIVNYLILLGWSPETNQEIFSMDELIKIFNPKRISKSPATFDIKKLDWVNQHYIKKLEFNEFKSLVLPHLKKAYDLNEKNDEWIDHLLRIYQPHISYGKEIIEVTDLFFKESITLNDEAKEFMESDESIKKTIKIFKEEIDQINDWSVDNINNAVNNVKEKSGAKGKLLYMPLRIKVSGQMHGPELSDTIFLLGKDIILKRLN